MDDLTERAWWVVEMPGGTIAFVPANTADDAYRALEATCYPKAPVREWPIVCSRWASRESIVRAALGRPVVGLSEPGGGPLGSDFIG